MGWHMGRKALSTLGCVDRPALWTLNIDSRWCVFAKAAATNSCAILGSRHNLIIAHARFVLWYILSSQFIVVQLQIPATYPPPEFELSFPSLSLLQACPRALVFKLCLSESWDYELQNIRRERMKLAVRCIQDGTKGPLPTPAASSVITFLGGLSMVSFT